MASTVSVKELKGVSDEIAEKLKAKGISNDLDYLEASKTPADRKSLASDLGIELDLVLEIANRADLSRLHGIAGVYSDLLENAGVDTVKELARRNAENLFAKLAEVNTALQLTTRPISQELVSDIIEQAKSLPATLEY